MKKFFIAALSAVIGLTVIFCGCAERGADGMNGKDGKDVSIMEVYQTFKAQEGNENITFEEFLKEYLSYDSSAIEEAASLQASINRSLLSGVSVLSRFTYNDVPCYVDGGVFGFGGSTSVGYIDYHQFGLGAGVIVDLDKEKGDAYIVTNCHVVYDDASKEIYSDEISLFLYGQDTEDVNYEIAANIIRYNGKDVYYHDTDGDYYLTDQQRVSAEKFAVPATVVGASLTYDIALLKVQGSDVLKNSSAVAAEFSESDDVHVGQSAYAVGNPRGYGMAVTQGIISKDSEIIPINMSSVDEESYNLYRVIRTDAAINGGNSGGGFYNAEGKLIGIINSKSVSEDIDNMSYALPASNVKRLWKLMRDAYEGGSNKSGVSRAFLSAEYEISDTRAYLNGNVAEIEENVVVTRDGGNLESGDSIRHIKIINGAEIIEDRDVTRMYHLEDALLSARRGYTVVVTVSRGGITREINAGYGFVGVS